MYGYTSEISLTNENLHEILQISTYLQMKRLIMEVVIYIQNKCSIYVPIDFPPPWASDLSFSIFLTKLREDMLRDIPHTYLRMGRSVDIEDFFLYNELIDHFNLLVYCVKPYQIYGVVQEQVDFVIARYFQNQFERSPSIDIGTLCIKNFKIVLKYTFKWLFFNGLWFVARDFSRDFTFGQFQIFNEISWWLSKHADRSHHSSSLFSYVDFKKMSREELHEILKIDTNLVGPDTEKRIMIALDRARPQSQM